MAPDDTRGRQGITTAIELVTADGAGILISLLRGKQHAYATLQFGVINRVTARPAHCSASASLTIGNSTRSGSWPQRRAKTETLSSPSTNRRIFAWGSRALAMNFSADSTLLRCKRPAPPSCWRCTCTAPYGRMLPFATLAMVCSRLTLSATVSSRTQTCVPRGLLRRRQSRQDNKISDEERSHPGGCNTC